MNRSCIRMLYLIPPRRTDGICIRNLLTLIRQTTWHQTARGAHLPLLGRHALSLVQTAERRNSVPGSIDRAVPRPGALKRIRNRLKPRRVLHPLVDIATGSYGIEHVSLHVWDASSRLIIGRYCSIADDVHVFLGGNHHHDWVTTYPLAPRPTAEQLTGERPGTSPYSNGNVTIGNDVWLGSHVTIMSGVTIGNGAVVAAYTHVVNDVAPYEIVGGNPGRHIKQRFSDEIVAELERIAWWGWPPEKIAAHSELLMSPPTAASLSQLSNLSGESQLDTP